MESRAIVSNEQFEYPKAVKQQHIRAATKVLVTTVTRLLLEAGPTGKRRRWRRWRQSTAQLAAQYSEPSAQRNAATQGPWFGPRFDASTRAEASLAHYSAAEAGQQERRVPGGVRRDMGY